MLYFDDPKPITRSRNWLALAEPTGIFLLIMLYIWQLRESHPSFWLFILGLIIVSHLWRGEAMESLGFQTANLKLCIELISPVVVFLALLLLALGILLQTTRDIEFERGIMGFVGYCFWGLFQQYLLNSYFVNRLMAVAADRNQAAWVAALFFAAAHTPNWFLMLVTVVAGYWCARVYLKYRNLYFLGLAHGAIGFLLYLTVPDTISHHLIVGPGWFR
jgi:hypothetical protein